MMKCLMIELQCSVRLLVRDDNLQRIDHIGSLRSIPVLLCHQRLADALRARPQIRYHQIGHLLIFLAR